MSTQLRNPSFRSRLRLFFVFIVVVPMIAMAVVLFLLIGESQRSQTDSALSQAQLAVQQIDSDLQAEAGQVAKTIGARSAIGERPCDEGWAGDSETGSTRLPRRPGPPLSTCT